MPRVVVLPRQRNLLFSFLMRKSQFFDKNLKRWFQNDHTKNIFNTYKVKILENVPRMTAPVSNTELNFVEC